MTLIQNIRKYRLMLLRAARSSRGRDLMLYFLFVCVAFVFWLVLSLDSEVQKDYDVPVELEEMPDSVTLIGQMPAGFSVLVQGKGSQFLRYTWGHMPSLKMKFNENVVDGNIFALSRQKIDGRLRDYFGQGVQIMSVKPDSVRIPFTSAPGHVLPLRINADVHADLQYIISGPLKASVDSVRIYSVNGVPRTLNHVETEPIIRNSLRDTARLDVRIKPIPGFRIIPERVIVTVPVEPLISRRRTVKVDVTGMPHNTRLFTFPSQVEVTYLVPMSAYNEDLPVKAFVDYQDVDPQKSRARVILSQMPDICHNVTVSPDSVEFIIEKNHMHQ
ncbi:MAG: hypothetical protein K2M85_05070 [Paramuribaculum sp.]|nr:hypothetical protein [Bacteroides sp.]MDE7460439.1 hypothetical protein [Paramuribaculum sp.]